MKARALVVAVAALAAAAPAGAAPETRCVDRERVAEGCFAALTEAFAAAAGGDTVEVAAGTYASAAVDKPIAVTGAPGGATVLEGELTTVAGSTLSRLTVDGPLELGGRGSRLVARAGVDLPGGALASSSVQGGVTAGAGASLHSVEVRVAEGDGVLAACGVTLRHLSVVGTSAAARGVVAACAARDVELADSVVWGEFSGEPLDGDVATRFSLHEDATRDATDPAAADPAFAAPADLRPAAGSPLVDAGEPEPLLGEEPVEDAARLSRVADGDGDGVVRRDIGAHERPATVVAVPGVNRLVNPGAEAGLSGWTGDMRAERYGGASWTPTAATGAALGGATSFFGAGAGTRLEQVVDVAGFAPEIDGGGVKVALSALLGGFRSEADEGSVTVTFRDPRDATISALALAPVTAADRAHGITLLHRAAAAPVPPLTRSMKVVLGARLVDGTYADAYFDNVSLVLDVPGRPPPPPPPPGGGGGDPGGGGGSPDLPPPPQPRAFAGVTVLTARATVDRRGRAPLRLGCATATVGRCAGVVTLTTVPRPHHPARRLGAATFSLAPGRLADVHVRIAARARRELRRKRRLRVRLYAAARDGQGQARASTSPLTLRRR